MRKHYIALVRKDPDSEGWGSAFRPGPITARRRIDAATMLVVLTRATITS
jgi:hypothetical protein